MVLILWFNRKRPLTEICGKQPCSQFLAFRNATRTRKFYRSSNVNRKPTRNPIDSFSWKWKPLPLAFWSLVSFYFFSYPAGRAWIGSTFCLTSKNRSENHNCRCIIYMSTISIRFVPSRCSSNLQHGGMISGMFRIFCDRKNGMFFRFHVWLGLSATKSFVCVFGGGISPGALDRVMDANTNSGRRTCWLGNGSFFGATCQEWHDLLRA